MAGYMPDDPDGLVLWLAVTHGVSFAIGVLVMWAYENWPRR